MRKNLLWIYLNIMPSAETILVIDVPMHSSRDLGRDTFTITPMSGPMHLSWFRPIQCFRISADAISSVVFGKSAEIRWLDVIGHLYTSGLAMLSVGFDWIMSVRHASNSHIGALVHNATQHCELIPSVQGIKCFPTRWEQVSVLDSGVGTTELWRGHSWIVG